MIDVSYLKFFILLIIVSACQVPSEYFKRPKIMTCIANGDGTAFCNGEEYNSTNMICSTPEEFNKALDYYSDKEYRLFRCLRYGRCN